MQFLQQLKLEAADRLRYSRTLRRTVARYRLFVDRLRAGGEADQAVRAVDRLCAAARLVADGPLLNKIEGQIERRLDAIVVGETDWSAFIPHAGDRCISKAAIIKPWISRREKGVVFVSFEDQWARLLDCDLARFAERYTLVVAPTWCPPHSLVNTAFPRAYPGPIFSLISNRRDLAIFPRLSPKYVMVPLYAASWVHPRLYQPRPYAARDIDVVMIANFGKYKRHHALFAALRRMPERVNVSLIGQPQDARTAETIRREAAMYGVANRVTVHSSVTNEFLADALCRAKVSLILSRREGSCVAVAESMFADTPVGMLRDAEVGSRAFINASTGRLLRERRLAEDLTAFLAAAPSIRPRQWAERNISCHHSTRLLNNMLREHALARGESWTRDIATVYWRPDPVVEEADDAIVREREIARERFGLTIGPGMHVEKEKFGIETSPASAAHQPLLAGAALP